MYQMMIKWLRASYATWASLYKPHLMIPMTISRTLVFGNVRKAAHSLLQIPKASYLEVNYRLCSRYKVSNSRLTSCTLCEVKERLWKSGGANNIYVLLASNKLSSHAQTTWKRLSHICFYKPILPPISRIACAVSLALTRSHLVAPGTFALIVGEITWTERTWAEAERFPSKDIMYMHAKDGHVYFASFVLSLLEGLILFLRAIYLAIIFSPCIAMAPFAHSFGIEFRKTWLRVVHLTLENAGPAIIKWGQWAATRRISSLAICARSLQNFRPKHQRMAMTTQKEQLKRLLAESFLKFLNSLKKNL